MMQMISLRARIHVKTELSFSCHFQSGFSSFLHSSFQLSLLITLVLPTCKHKTSSGCTQNPLNLKHVHEANNLREMICVHTKLWESRDLFPSGSSARTVCVCVGKQWVTASQLWQPVFLWGSKAVATKARVTEKSRFTED